MKSKILFTLLSVCVIEANVNTDDLKQQVSSEAQNNGVYKAFEFLASGLKAVADGCAKAVVSTRDHFVEHGKGELALEQLGTANKHIEKMEDIAQEAVKALGGATSQQAQLAEHIQEQVKAQKNTNTILQNGIEKIKENPFGTTLTCITTGFMVYSLVEGTHKGIVWAKSWFPSEEEKQQQALEKETVTHKLRLLRATNAMNKCLFENENNEKNMNGMPCACENVLKEFGIVAGAKALSEAKKSFIER